MAATRPPNSLAEIACNKAAPTFGVDPITGGTAPFQNRRDASQGFSAVEVAPEPVSVSNFAAGA